MIDVIDAQVLGWIRGLLPEAEATLAAPANPARGEKTTAHCHLVGIDPMPAPRSTDPRQRQPLQVALRYLLMVRGAAPEVEHRAFARLLFAALDRDDWQVEFGPIPPAFWSATGIVPSPAMVLRVPARLERPAPEAPLVREPVVVRRETIRRLSGRVVSPRGTPVAYARVAIPSLRLVTDTDAGGGFAFAAVPSSAVAVTVTARGRRIAVEAAAGADPLTIAFPTET